VSNKGNKCAAKTEEGNKKKDERSNADNNRGRRQEGRQKKIVVPM